MSPGISVAVGVGVAVAVGMGVAVGEGVAVSVGGFGVSIGVGGTGVEVGGRGVLVASTAIRVAAGATGVFVETGNGVAVDPQPTKRSKKHTTKAISVPRTITRASSEKSFLDISFLLMGNNPLPRLNVQANTSSFHHHTHCPKDNLIPHLSPKS